MALLLPASAHRRVPWRNGCGATDEIVVAPLPPGDAAPGDATSHGFAWRVSVAHVETAAPFSAYPGVDRMLMLVDGAGMDLRFGDAPWRRIDRPFEPIRFAGETPVHCRLVDGPVRDFNVMTDRAVATADVLVVAHPGEASRSPFSGAVGKVQVRERLVVAFHGAVVVRIDGVEMRLAPVDAVRLGADETIVVEALERGARAVVVEVG